MKIVLKLDQQRFFMMLQWRTAIANEKEKKKKEEIFCIQQYSEISNEKRKKDAHTPFGIERKFLSTGRKPINDILQCRHVVGYWLCITTYSKSLMKHEQYCEYISWNRVSVTIYHFIFFFFRSLVCLWFCFCLFYCVQLNEKMMSTCCSANEKCFPESKGKEKEKKIKITKEKWHWCQSNKSISYYQMNFSNGHTEYPVNSTVGINISFQIFDVKQQFKMHRKFEIMKSAVPNWPKEIAKKVYYLLVVLRKKDGAQSTHNWK